MQVLWSDEFLTPGLACFLGMLLGVCVCVLGTPVWGRKLSYLISHLPSDQETRFHPLLCQSTAEWCWASHFYSPSFCTRGFTRPALSFSNVITKFTRENTRRGEMEKLQPLSPRGVLFWLLPLWLSQTAATLRARLPAASLCWRFILRKVLFRSLHPGFEAIYQTPLPGTALRCWQQVAGSLQMCCLFQQRNIRGGRERVRSSFCQTTHPRAPSQV